MKILAIETATEACSAALYLDGQIRCSYQVQPQKHSELILPMMQQLLSDGGIKLPQLDCLAFGCGPGSFTGVRIATGVIQGAAFGAGLPVVPVSTLAALAQRYYREQGGRRLLPAFDARMGEVYWGCYQIDDRGLAVQLVDDSVLSPGQVPQPDGSGWIGVGSGWGAHGDALRARLASSVTSSDSKILCSAWDIALLAAAGLQEGKAVAAERALPVYLRDRVAWLPGKLPGK